MTPQSRRSLMRIAKSFGYTEKLTKNYNNFVLDGLERWGMVARSPDKAWVNPTGLGLVVAAYLEAQELEAK